MTSDILAAGTDLTAFGRDPWWLVVAKAIAIFVFLILTPLVALLAERKVMAWMQMRVGPNRVGPRGTLQSLADGIKLALKEGIVPSGVDRPVYLLAPIIATVPAFMAFAVIPFGPVVSAFGQRTPLQLTDLPVAVGFGIKTTEQAAAIAKVADAAVVGSALVSRIGAHVSDDGKASPKGVEETLALVRELSAGVRRARQ